MDMIPWQPMTNDAPQGLPAGTSQAVHITLNEEDLDWLLAKLDRWFAGRDEISQIENGTSDKQGVGFVLLEWDGCMIDPLFLRILEEEARIIDFTVYDREEI